MRALLLTTALSGGTTCNRILIFPTRRHWIFPLSPILLTFSFLRNIFLFATKTWVSMRTCLHAYIYANTLGFFWPRPTYKWWALEGMFLQIGKKCLRLLSDFFKYSLNKLLAVPLELRNVSNSVRNKNYLFALKLKVNVSS